MTPIEREWRRRKADIEDGMKEVAMDIREKACYSDGSGKHGDKLDWALKTLREQQDRIDNLRAFINSADCDTLAGLTWEVSLFDSEIHVGCKWRNGAPTSAMAVATLWPDLNWERVRPCHGINEETERDWLSDPINGVRIRITRAEFRSLPKEPPAWPSPKKVHLP